MVGRLSDRREASILIGTIVEKEHILPRPVDLNEGLVKKWLGPEGVEEFLRAGDSESERTRILGKIEAAIRESYPDGLYPPVHKLLNSYWLSPREIEELRKDKKQALKQLRQIRRDRQGRIEGS